MDDAMLDLLGVDTDTPARFRERFPVLSDTVHLASCSQGAASTDLSAALLEFQRSLRERGAPWDSWMAEVERSRQLFARMIHADPGEVAVVPCASDGAYQVASTHSWAERPRIITTDMEFPSVAHVWLAQRPLGAEVTHVPERNGVVVADDLASALDDRVSLVSVPFASYRNGARMPVSDVVAAARRVGARVFVDAYQAAGVLPVDVRELDCDYLVAGALKYLLGVPGIAFLYVRGGLTDEIAPQLTGWFGRVDPFTFDPHALDFAPTARRFETGTPSIPSAYAAVAGLTCLARVDLPTVAEHVGGLAAELHENLTRAGERIWSPADPGHRGAQVAVVDDQPDELASFLADRRIVTAPRGHVLRLSLHYYNDRSDVEKVCAAIAEYRRQHGSTVR